MKLACAVLLLCPIAAIASTVQWDSATTGTTLTGEILEPTAVTDGPPPTVVYLKNLSILRLGTEADEQILADLQNSGHLVLVLDYAKSAKAVSPNLNADVLKIRQDIADAKNKKLLANRKIDANHLFILMEGFRLKRDVEFARDGKRVLGMDIIYPAKPAKPVPALMEITCDNQNRMGAGSLLFCRDTLLEGGEAAGFAVAMVDHPVAPPYKGIDDPMPQCIERMHAAVKTLRANGGDFGMNGNIGVIGFSRGATMADPRQPLRLPRPPPGRSDARALRESLGQTRREPGEMGRPRRGELPDQRRRPDVPQHQQGRVGGVPRRAGEVRQSPEGPRRRASVPSGRRHPRPPRQHRSRDAFGGLCLLCQAPFATNALIRKSLAQKRTDLSPRMA
jgi:hypothetical protein